MDGQHGLRANNTPQTSTLKVTKIQRIENVALWQSYAAKLNSMKQRLVTPVQSVLLTIDIYHLGPKLRCSRLHNNCDMH